MLYIEKKTPPREMVREVSEIKSDPGWKAIKDGNTKAIRDEFDKLPKEAQNYVLRIEELCGVRISSIGVGPDRDQNI